MTYTELVQILGWRLGDRTDMAPRIAAEIPNIQSTILEGNPWLPWFLEKESVGLFTTAGVQEVPFPADFLGESENAGLSLVNADGREILLQRGDVSQLSQALPGEGFPVAYALSATGFRLYPLPTDVLELRLWYMGRAESLLPPTDVGNPWLVHASDVVVSVLGTVIAGQHLRDAELRSLFEQAALVAWNRLYQKHVALGECGRDREMGGLN